MPVSNTKSKPVHERQIEIARNEKSKFVNGLIEKITSLALNSEKVKKKLAEVVCRGLDQYSLSLLEQVDRIGTTKLNLNSSNFKLTKNDIEALEEINDTQRLLLHQVLNNNIIRDNIQKLSTGSYELANILNFLQGIDDLNQYASHMAKFPEYDPDSFRKFQILNNYSYSIFTRTIYDETLHKNQDHLATTINQYIQELIDKIHEDTSDSVPHVYEHDSLQYQDALVQNFMEAVKEVLKGSEQDHEKIVRAIQDKIPSLLQISNDTINEKQLKQSINELLDLEELTGDFHLTVEYFNSYFEACYPIRATDHKESRKKTAADKEKAVEKIRFYIEYIREIRKNDHIQYELLEIKNERLKLSEIKNNIKKLQIQELFSSSVMPDGSEKELTAILSKLSELGYDKLTELLSTYSDFVKDNKEKLIAFKTEYSIPGNVNLLIKLLESKLDRQNFSPRAQYYEGLLKTIDQNLAQKDAKLIEFINVKTDHAVTICHNPDECESEVISDDKTSVIPTNVFNPLVHKMAKHMPRDMADKLKIFNEIENEIAVTELTLAEGNELRTLDGNDSIAIKSAYDNLEKTRAVLIKKSRLIETDILKFTISKISLLVQDQKDLFLQDHKDRLDAIISPISLEEKQQLDQNLHDETKELFETLHKLNEKLRDSANFSRDMIVPALLKIGPLILQLGLKKFAGKRKFDFSEVSSDLKKLTKYYKNVPSNRLAGIERDPTSIKYTSEKDLITSLIGYGKFIARVIDFFRAIYNGLKVTFSAITYGFNQMFGLLFRTFARMSSNNQKLLKMIDQLVDDVQKSDCEKQFKTKLLEDIDIMRSKVGRLTAKTSSILEEFGTLQSRFLTRDTIKTEVEEEANTPDMIFSDSDEETDILDSSLPKNPISPTGYEHEELLARLMKQAPTDAAVIAKDACHQFTVPKEKELIHHKIETIALDVNTKLTDLQHQLTEQLVLERHDQAKIEVLAAQIRTLESTKSELSTIAKEFDSLKDKLPGDDTVQGLNNVDRSLKKVEYNLRLYEGTVTAIERMDRALSAFLEDKSPEKAATEALLKNVLTEISEQSKNPTSTTSSIARSALLAALDKAPPVVEAMTGKLSVTHEMRACKQIIDSTFKAAIDALKDKKNIQGITKACRGAAAQSLIEETVRLGVVLVGTEQPSNADKQFKKKIKQLSQSMSTLSLEIFTANQGFQLLLLMVDRHPNLRPLLEQTLNRVRDVTIQALKDGKTYEEMVSAAKTAMIQEIKTVLMDAPTHQPKTIVHEAPEELGGRIKSSLRQLELERVALREQEEKLTTQDEPNKELLRGQLIKIRLQIKEKSESIEKIKQIQYKFDAVLVDEAALNSIAGAYPDGAERYQLIYRVEQYEPIKKRKIELEQELDDIVSPGLLTQVHSFVEQSYATSSLPTQEAISAGFRNVVLAAVGSVEQGDLATDTAIKVLDVALQGWLDMMKMLSFASGERGKAIEDLIKTSIEAAVKANHNDTRATVDLNFLAKQAVIKALEEIQKDDVLKKITIDLWRGKLKELVLIGAEAAISKLKEENSTLSEAKDIFLLAVSQRAHNLWTADPFQLAGSLLLPKAEPLVPPLTVPEAKELIDHKIEAILLDVNTKLTHLQHQLTEQLVLERREQGKIEVLAAQIRTLESTKSELSTIAKEFDSLKDKLPGDDTVQGLNNVDRSLKKVEYNLRLYEGTATAIERMDHALSAFLEDKSPEKAATEALLKNVLTEISEQSKNPTSTTSSIARSALLAALDKAPSVVEALTDKLSVTHEMRACKQIIDSTFKAAIDALKDKKNIQGITKACRGAAAQSLIEETVRLGVVLVGTEQPSNADKQFKKKIKKLSQSMSTLSLEIFAANQGFQILLLMVERYPNLRPLLEQTLNRVRDVTIQALKDGKTYEEMVSAAKTAMIQEIKMVFKDAPITHQPKTIVHEAPEELGSRIESSFRQLELERVALREQEEKLTTQDEPNKELLRGQLIKIRLQIQEKSESIEKIRQIQYKFEDVLADEATLNRIAEDYPEGAERYQLIYRVEKYEPIKKRKIELEQELDDIVSPGLLTQVHSFIEQSYATSSLPTQEAISAVFRNVVLAVSDSVEKGDLATDTAIKGLDVALQGWVDVMKLLSFASGERGKAIEDLIKTSIEAAVKANHNDTRATVDFNFLAKQAVLKALEEIQKDDVLNKITIDMCRGTQKELVRIGAGAAINKLKEENSTLSEAKDIFLLAVSQNVHSLWAPNPIQLAVRLLLPTAVPVVPLVPPQKAEVVTTTTPIETTPDQKSITSQVTNYLGSFFNNPKVSPPGKSDPDSNPTVRQENK